MSKRSKNYQLTGGVESEPVISPQKNPEILESSIKKLTYHPALTPEWFTLANEIERICNISSIESTTNSEINSKLNSMGTHSVGTLWDTEKTLDTLRLLVENHKVNTLIHLTKDLKDLTRSSSFFEQINGCSQRINRLPEEVINRVDHFEFDLGILLKRLFEYVEAIQVSDIGMFIDYIYSTLRAIIDSRFNPENIEVRQEGLVFSYLYGIFHFIEQLNEPQIVQQVRNLQLPALMVEVILEKSMLFTNACKQKMLEALGAIADCVGFM